MTTPISSGASTGSSDTSSTGAAFAPNQLGEQAFLQLLIAELKNQDPNQPMDGQAMITQLAQLNQTQATMQSLTFQQETFASSLVGKSVTGTANGKPTTGIATDFAVNGSTVSVTVNGQAMNVTDVTGVSSDTTTTNAGGTTNGNGGTTNPTPTN